MSAPRELPEAAIPRGTSTANLLRGGWAQSHFRRQAEPVDAIPTPLEGWNRQCRDEGGGVGLAKGWYVIVAGATGHGKSLAALNMGAHAVRQGVSVGFVSLEMSTTQLATRLYALMTKTPVRMLERGHYFDADTADAVAYEVEELRAKTGATFSANVEPIFDLRDVLKLMAHYEEEGCRLIVVDYLQLVSSGDEKEQSREVTQISHAMRVFAKRKGVVVVGLSQFNRSTSANRDASPLVQGLIGSSSLENDADQVILLDHSRYERGVSPTGADIAKTWAVIGKNRHGGAGSLAIEWNYRTLEMREGREDELNEWPDRGESNGGKFQRGARK